MIIAQVLRKERIMECKSCQIDFSKRNKKGFKYPDNIPVSKDMKQAVEIARGKNNEGRRKRR